MTWDQFFTALMGAIPGIGAAVAAVWRSNKKQSDEAAERKRTSRADHERLEKKLDSLAEAFAKELKKKDAAIARLAKERDELRANLAFVKERDANDA